MDKIKVFRHNIFREIRSIEKECKRYFVDDKGQKWNSKNSNAYPNNPYSGLRCERIVE